MRTVFLAGLAAGLLLTIAPAAQAHPTYHYWVDCSFVTVSDGTDGPDTVWTGEADVRVVATDDLDVPGAVVPISVDCILVNETAGTETVALSASGAGAAVGAGSLLFEADPDDWIRMCWAVTVGGEEHVGCPPVPGGGSMEEWMQDLIDAVFGSVDQAEREICAVAASAGPGVAGVVDVTPEGDVFVAGEWFWDCPPYGT